MNICYQKKDGGFVSQKDYTILCLRFACESYGCPIFGPKDRKTLEFPNEDDINGLRKKVLESEGFIEVTK